MNPSIWPDALENVWAKSADKGMLGQAETLAQHTWSVLNQLAALQRLRPRLPAELNLPSFWNILYWAAFFHDFGKALPAFQAVLRGGPRWQQRHEVFSLTFLEWVSGGLSQEEQDWIAAGIVSHHKEASDLVAVYLAEEEQEELEFFDELLETLPAQTVASLWDWSARIAPIWIDDLNLRAAGVRSVAVCTQQEAAARLNRSGAKAIYQRISRYNRLAASLQKANQPAASLIGLLLRGHLVNADHAASAHVEDTPRFNFSADIVRKKMTGELYEHQQKSWEAEGCAMLASPTGSGKTEAGLLWAARQHHIQPNGLPRLFYTLPYQASMNAMLLRLQSAFQTSHIGLQHGRGLLAHYRLLMERSYEPKQAEREARLSRNMAELNQYPIRVFSPYQMLKGAYRLKGYEPLLMDYHGAAFIFDEIHAYEPARLAMIFQLMEFLRNNYHSTFFVMSATFPNLIRDRLRQVLGGPVEIAASPELFSRFQRHRLKLLDGDLLDNLAMIAAQALTGRSVLVVCNRVDRAQQAYTELRERLAPNGIAVELLHGRFHIRDRSSKEALIRSCAGLHSNTPRPLVLVSTQAVEVSLDIDLNTIYTDPAPLEALVQRFGRVNRARLQQGLAAVHVFRQPDDGQKVYDAELIRRTLTLLEREDGQTVDEGRIGDWLEEIYQDSVAARWAETYQKSADDFQRAVLRSLTPFAASPELEEAFYAAFDSVEVLPECLLPVYESQQKANPILADELLVPIRWGRYHWLANHQMLLPRDKSMPPIVRCGYNAEIGLDFDGRIDPTIED